MRGDRRCGAGIAFAYRWLRSPIETRSHLFAPAAAHALQATSVAGDQSGTMVRRRGGRTGWVAGHDRQNVEAIDDVNLPIPKSDTVKSARVPPDGGEPPLTAEYRGSPLRNKGFSGYLGRKRMEADKEK